VRLIRIEARISSWLTGPRVISFWARSRPRNRPAKSKAMASPRLAGSQATTTFRSISRNSLAKLSRLGRPIDDSTFSGDSKAKN